MDLRLLCSAVALVGCGAGPAAHGVDGVSDTAAELAVTDDAPSDSIGRIDTANGRNADGLTPLPCAPECGADALTRLNEWRGWLGLPEVSTDEALQQAAADHTTYYLHHWPDRFEDTGRSAHDESPGTEGYTGQDPAARMAAAGYEGMPLGEVMAFQSAPEQAVDDWMASLYHRVPLLLPLAAHVGYGGASRGGRICQTLDVGTPAGVQFEAADTIVIFPPDEATGVPTRWEGLEKPRPPLDTGYPSGPILTVIFGSASADAFPAINVEQCVLDGPDGPVEHVALAPGDDPALCCGVVALYATTPLQPGATYTVTLHYRRASVSDTLTWSFTTASEDTATLDAMRSGTD